MKCNSKRVPDSSSDRRSFPETHWSVVLTAGQVGTPKASEALEILCGAYWYPLYAFARRQGNSPPDAQDLTQSFFQQLLEKNSVSKAKYEKGRFRSFLLKFFRYFLFHERDRNRAQKRGGGVELLSWDELSAEDALAQEPADNSTPEKLYDRNWAVTVLKRALTRTEEEYRTRDKEKLFEHLRVFLQGESASVSYAQLGKQLGMTEGAIKVEVHRMRKYYRRFLKEEISHTVATKEEIQDELDYLWRSLSD